MKNYILLFGLSIILFSCDSSGQNEPTAQIDLENIADSPYFIAYAKAMDQKIASSVKKEFDLEGIMTYIDQHHPNEEDLCTIDFSTVPVKGMAKYINQTCQLNNTLTALKDHVPIYNKLTQEQRDEVLDIYFSKHPDREMPTPKNYE